MAAKELLKFMLNQNPQDPYDFTDLYDLLTNRSQARNAVPTAQATQTNATPTSNAAGFSGTGTVAPGKLPVEGRITMKYGDPASWFKGGTHPGVDIAVASGTPIPSVGGGKVISAGPEGNWGNSVVVQLPNGQKARYAHLSQINVREGDTIQDNQIVGATGSTGYSTGPHLHYQIYQ